LSKEEIKKIVQKFVDATKRAIKAGFDVVEIHGAHGYLISSFNSPISNERTDEYGGCFENRIRFCLEVTKAVRDTWPADKPLFVRISCTDWCEGGWDMEQTVRLAKLLKNIGVDLIDCTSGGQSPRQRIKESPGFQVPFAEQVKREADILVGAVGVITDPAQAEEIVSNKKADLLMIARQMLRDSKWVLTVAKSLGVDVDWPLQYERSKL